MGMKALGKGCIEFLIVWTLAALGLYYAFQQQFTRPGPMWGAVIGGFLVAGSWGLIRNALQARSQASLVRRALAGEWPRDGAPFAAIGQPVALRETLQTPFGNRPCALYSYELSRTDSLRVRTNRGHRTERQRLVFLSGVAMAPWAVRTRSGDVAVLGFPIPDQYPETKLSLRERGGRLRSYVDETKFTTVGKWEIGKMLGYARALIIEDDGQLRQDLKFAEADEILNDPRALMQCDLIEQFIPLDKPVCVIGKFDQSQRGLVNDWSKGGLQAIPGNAEQGMKSLQSLARSRFVFAVILAALGIGGGFGLLAIRENSTGIRQIRAEASAEIVLAALETGDPAVLEAAFQQGASSSSVDTQGQPIILSVSSLELLDVFVRHGASLETVDSVGRPLLLRAIDVGNQPMVEWLIAAGADVNHGQGPTGRTPLESALDRGQVEMVAILRSHNARAVFVGPGDGEPIGDDAADFVQCLNEFSQAVNSRDGNRAAAYCDDWPDDYFVSVDRGLYADMQPKVWQMESGFRNAEAATMIATGLNARGIPERYVVTFVQRGGRWLIRRSYWDERHAFAF